MQPLILLATSNVSIDGTIDASGAKGGGSIMSPDCNNPVGGAGGIAGPGGFAGGAGVMMDDVFAGILGGLILSVAVLWVGP